MSIAERLEAFCRELDEWYERRLAGYGTLGVRSVDCVFMECWPPSERERLRARRGDALVKAVRDVVVAERSGAWKDSKAD